MSRSLNRAQIIGNAVKDGEFKLTPSNTPICTFTVATNRSWKTAAGELKEETDFHRIVAWQKLAEICKLSIKKGVKVYVEGRISSKKLEDGTYVHEIVADDVIVLDRVKTEEPTVITEITETIEVTKEV